MSWLWLITLLGFSASGISLQRRYASLGALLRTRRPDLWRDMHGDTKARSEVALWRWILSGHWQRLDDEPLIRAYAGTCLRLLRLSVAWLVGLAVTLVLL